MWKNCRNRDQDFKALRLAVTLSHSYVQYVDISYNYDKIKYDNYPGKCKKLRYLSLAVTGTVIETELELILSELPSLYCLTVAGDEFGTLHAAKAF